MNHIRRYGWMARRANNDKLAWLQKHHGVTHQEAEEQKAENDEADMTLEEPERTHTCRFCDGKTHLTGGTLRPRVCDIMQKPLTCFRTAQAGARITLGKALPRIQAERSNLDPLSSTRNWAAEIQEQLSALLTSSYL